MFTIKYRFNSYLFSLLVTTILSTGMAGSQNLPGQKLLAYWSFERVKHLNGELTSSIADQPLTADARRPSEPQPFLYDESGNENFLQVRGEKKPGGDTRRSVCLEYLNFEPDGSIKPIDLTTEGVSITSKK